MSLLTAALPLTSFQRISFLVVAVGLVSADAGCQRAKFIATGAHGEAPEFWVNGRRIVLASGGIADTATGVSSLYVAAVDPVTHEAIATRHDAVGDTGLVLAGESCEGSSLCNYLEHLAPGSAILVEVPAAAFNLLKRHALESPWNVGFVSSPAGELDSGYIACIGSTSSDHSPTFACGSVGLRATVEGEVFCEALEQESGDVSPRTAERNLFETQEKDVTIAGLVVPPGPVPRVFFVWVARLIVILVLALLCLCGCYVRAMRKAEARSAKKIHATPEVREMDIKEYDREVSTRLLERSAEDDTETDGIVDYFRLSASKDTYDYYEEMELDDGTCIDSAIPWSASDRFEGRKVVVVLEGCALELSKTVFDRKSPLHEFENELLTTHECLISLSDSPLNKTGQLIVFLHSAAGRVVEVHPSMRIPRNFRVFTELIYNLLKTGSVSGVAASFPLMKVLQGPVDRWLPSDCPKFGLVQGGRATCLRDIAAFTCNQAEEQEVPCKVVFAIGASRSDAIADEQFKESYCTEFLAVCAHGLRSHYVCQMVCSEYYAVWGPQAVLA